MKHERVPQSPAPGASFLASQGFVDSISKIPLGQLFSKGFVRYQFLEPVDKGAGLKGLLSNQSLVKPLWDFVLIIF